MRLVIISIVFGVLCVLKTLAESPQNEKERLFVASTGISFTTFTLIKTTTTLTSTTTMTTTCTTSTAALATCTTGRRRRGLFFDEKEVNSRHRRAGLFYNDNEVENKDGSVFLPSDKNPTEEIVSTRAENTSIIPLDIEAGFSVPQGTPNRFLLAFGTSTFTSIVISTSTFSLTAICLSTTGFPLCGGAGK
ncbi:uncharacterized protein LOC124328315 [Daphnia pulicaria]|uniref:uncharacterized protein LOC124328315 n=1 Tax=Daphnia pulicaria TaxID=35523 RepID=UPI001EEABA91|nr:uncharacterized protein LOC124328315 [Daphnia pulicaria]